MLSGASEARTQFIEANAASARALGAGDLPDINSHDIDELPLDLVAPATIQDIKLIRGLVDSPGTDSSSPRRRHTCCAPAW